MSTERQQTVSRREFLRRVGGGAALALATVAVPSPAGTSPAYAQSSSLTPLRLGAPSPQPASAIMYVTTQAGLFQKYGIDASFSVLGTATQVMQGAMLSGEVPITYQAAPAIITADLAGLDIAIFQGLINTTFFAVYSQPDISSPEDLRGKRIGTSGPGSNDFAAGALGLAKFGMEFGKDVTSVTIGGGSAQELAALQTGQIDAVVISSPATYQAQKLGYNLILDLGASGIDYQSGTLSARRSWLDANRDTALGVARAIGEGIHFMKTRKDETIALMSQYTQSTDQDLLEASYNDFALKYISKVPRPTLTGIQYIIDNVVQDPRAQGHQASEYVDLSFVDQLEQEGFYSQLWNGDTAGV